MGEDICQRTFSDCVYTPCKLLICQKESLRDMKIELLRAEEIELYKDLIDEVFLKVKKNIICTLKIMVKYLGMFSLVTK